MWNPLNYFRKKQTNVIEYTNDMRKADSYFGNALKTLRRMSQGLGFGISPDGKRDYNALYGYEVDLSYDDYFVMYKRGGIANVVVAKVAKACWRDMPKLMVGKTEVLKEEMIQLKKLGLFRTLERADIMNRIGDFSVLLVGIPDGLELDQPLGTANSFDGVYFRAYSEDGTEFTAWDNDATSPRFDLPTKYQVRTVDHGDKDKTVSTTARIADHTRIVHLAEGSLDSPIEGSSALEPCWNALVDKEKVRGGSGEAYYRNARQKYALEADKGTAVDNSTDGVTSLREEVEAFTNDQQDFLRLQNMKAKIFQPGQASPRDTFDICVEEIAGVTGIAIRILTGKGGGQLAGSEDRASWNSLTNDRQESECSDYLMNSLKIFDAANLIKLPDNVVIEWPKQSALSETEDSEILGRKAKAFNDLSTGIKNLDEDADTNQVLKAAGFDDDVGIDTTDLPDDDDKDL